MRKMEVRTRKSNVLQVSESRWHRNSAGRHRAPTFNHHARPPPILTDKEMFW